MRQFKSIAYFTLLITLSTLSIPIVLSAQKSEYNRPVVAAAPREVKVVSTTANRGQNVLVSINVDAAGDENVYGFSLNYDSTKLSNPVVTIGTAGGVVSSNVTQAGRIGVSVSFGGGTITAGNNQNLVKIQFVVASGAATGATPLAFGDQPTFREVASAPPNPMALPTTFTDGTITINAPTAASVSVGGRVLSARGRGIFRAVVTLTDMRGETRFAMTNPFGFYRFEEVSLGETYFLSVSHKRYQFAPQGLTLAGEVNGLNFIAQQ